VSHYILIICEPHFHLRYVGVPTFSASFLTSLSFQIPNLHNHNPVLSFELHWYIYSGASVHERPCSRTIRFTNKFSEQKPTRMTNGFSDYEHASWQQRQAERIRTAVSCWLTLAQYTSLLDFGLRTFRFTNGLQERIKFVNRGPTVYISHPHSRFLFRYDKTDIFPFIFLCFIVSAHHYATF
jgi:hypothetical protein